MRYQGIKRSITQMYLVSIGFNLKKCIWGGLNVEQTTAWLILMNRMCIKLGKKQSL